MTAVPLLAQCLLSLAAFSSLCLATPRNARQLNHPRWRAPLYWGGWLLLGTAAITAVTTGGWGPGLAALFGALTLAAFIVIGLATYRPGGLVHLLVAGMIGGAWLLGKLLLGAAAPDFPY